jgi:hypothetical protein
MRAATRNVRARLDTLQTSRKDSAERGLTLTSSPLGARLTHAAPNQPRSMLAGQECDFRLSSQTAHTETTARFSRRYVEQLLEQVGTLGRDDAPEGGAS